ncbi:hypothetical protein K1719_044150 [Acacia pycnantha]|nr:hypothetical protein K1719_044150 [Acacia pycnantha]
MEKCPGQHGFDPRGPRIHEGLPLLHSTHPDKYKQAKHDWLKSNRSCYEQLRKELDDLRDKLQPLMMKYIKEKERIDELRRLKQKREELLNPNANRESLIEELALVSGNRFCLVEENWLSVELSKVYCDLATARQP